MCSSKVENVDQLPGRLDQVQWVASRLQDSLQGSSAGFVRRVHSAVMLWGTLGIGRRFWDTALEAGMVKLEVGTVEVEVEAGMVKVEAGMVKVEAEIVQLKVDMQQLEVDMQQLEADMVPRQVDMGNLELLEPEDRTQDSASPVGSDPVDTRSSTLVHCCTQAED